MLQPDESISGSQQPAARSQSTGTLPYLLVSTTMDCGDSRHDREYLGSVASVACLPSGGRLSVTVSRGCCGMVEGPRVGRGFLFLNNKRALGANHAPARLASVKPM